MIIFLLQMLEKQLQKIVLVYIMEKLHDYVILMGHGLILIHQNVLLRFVKVMVYFLTQKVVKQLL